MDAKHIGTHNSWRSRRDLISRSGPSRVLNSWGLKIYTEKESHDAELVFSKYNPSAVSGNPIGETGSHGRTPDEEGVWVLSLSPLRGAVS